MKLNIKIILFDIIRLILAFIFVLSSIEKLKDPYAFALSVDAYQVFPDWIVNLSTLLIPWLELFIAFGLIFKFKLRANLILFGSLMIMFTLLVVIAMIKGLDIECGCYGESSSKVGLTKLVENILIIIGCSILYSYYFIVERNK